MCNCLLECFIREYIKLRRQIAEENNYRLYSYYSLGIKGPLYYPVNICKLFIGFVKDFRKKEYPENYDFEFIRDASNVFSQLYGKMYSEEGLKIGDLVLSREYLLKAKHCLENIINTKESYLSYLNFALGFIGGLIMSFVIPEFFPNLTYLISSKANEKPIIDVNELIGEIILFIVLFVVFVNSMPQFATNILLKLNIYKELLTIINLRLEEFELKGTK